MMCLMAVMARWAIGMWVEQRFAAGPYVGHGGEAFCRKSGGCA
jgi:hypothetical protein